MVAAIIAGMMAPVGAKGLNAAELSSMSCDSAEINLPDIPAGTASLVETASLQYAPESVKLAYTTDKLRADFEQYRTKWFPRFQKGVSGCKDARRRNRATALYNVDIAAIKHGLNPSGDWVTTMNLATQQLERCVTDYYGTTKGAECQTKLEDNRKLKLKWQSAP